MIAAALESDKQGDLSADVRLAGAYKGVFGTCYFPET